MNGDGRAGSGQMDRAISTVASGRTGRSEADRVIDGYRRARDSPVSHDGARSRLYGG